MKTNNPWGLAAAGAFLALGFVPAEGRESAGPVAPSATARNVSHPRVGWLGRLGFGAASPSGAAACGVLPTEDLGDTEKLKDLDGRSWTVTEANIPGLAGTRSFLCADGDWIRFGRGERILAVRRQGERKSIEVLTQNKHRGGDIDYWMVPGREVPAATGVARIVDPADLDTGWARLDLARAGSDPKAAWAAAVLSRLPTRGRP